ncbi:hypothetical protein [Weissella confusa]|uniref:hypothetical protein n=1 Tax=Weissella confusa TaxID=1583 RepID=UPI0018F10B48|nr:hypothetical protein [Weissella confusa]MBJ7624064.1 hypothetical protein [Weissella confusa]MBJ7651991.1 hypothetical protein [Weissella confusa]MBJ7658088.1 hypothetical protein [Weissella confusa]MBJ7666011.1 hypothetical protein [Weissella confusa]MBJ7675734.1 hypothetical protein [Weissella confusa]
MNKKNTKILLVTFVGLSTMGVTVATQTTPVAASPYASGLESETGENPKQIVINLVDDAGHQVTWTQSDGTNGGSSIEYPNQDGNLSGEKPINLPDNLVAHSAMTSDKGAVYDVRDGKLYVDLATISGQFIQFTLNANQKAVSQPDAVANAEGQLSDPAGVGVGMVPNEPQYMTSEAVVPNEPVVAPAAPHSGALVPNQTPSVSSEATIAPTVSATPRTSSVTKPVSAKVVTSVSVEPSVSAAVASAASVAPVATQASVASSAQVVTTSIAKTVNAVNQTSVPTSATIASVAPAASNSESKTPAQAVKNADLISSIGDLPKSSVWTDKARTFSAISIGMSVLAAGAQLLMTKLGFIKSFL